MDAPRITVERAGPQHDAALRALFAQTEMSGAISVRFEREPEFRLGTEAQGGHAEVAVAVDCRTGQVLGCGARALRPAYVNGEPQTVGYLGDLRVSRGLPAAARGSVMLQLFRALREAHRDGRAALYSTVIMSGNRPALAALSAGHRALPRYRDLGRIICPAVNLLRPIREARGGIEIVPGSADRADQIAACLQRSLAPRQLAPVYSAPQLRGEPSGCEPPLHGLRIEDFRLALRGAEVVGVVAGWDQSAFKQTIVTGYSGPMRAAVALTNTLGRPFGLPRYPAPGEPLRFFYAACLAVNDDNVGIAAALLRRLYNEHVGGKWHYFLVGLHERDPLLSALRGFVTTPFAGRLFAVHFPDGEDEYAALDNRVPYVELALL